MKEIIPLKKDVTFKTTIGKITNINLEHNYDVKDNMIEGTILVYGTYKMTEASVIDEDFSFKVPFGISISKRIKKDTISIEIDDFKYDINSDVLSVSIDLEFMCNEEENIIPSELEIPIIEEPIIEENKEDSTINNITNNFNMTDNYYTYKVYIVREGDTIESICNKYNVDISNIKEYNNIENINIGDKIIIPYIDE